MFIQLFDTAYDVQFDAKNQVLTHAKRVADSYELTIDELDALNNAVESQVDEIFAEEIVDLRIANWTNFC